MLARLLAAGVVVAVSVSLSPHAVAADAYSSFHELSVGSYHGVGANWTDVNWANVPCPSNQGFISRVNTFVNVLDNDPETLAWAQLGYQKRRYYTGQPSQCVLEHRYYWERALKTLGGTDDYALGTIDSPSPLGSHSFNLNRLTTGCASGNSYCWHFRIDGNTKHTCCGAWPTFTTSDRVSTQIECRWDTSTSSCPAGGSLDITGLQYKTTGGSWLSWTGQDRACVDHGKGARGKWLSATQVAVGFNVSMSGTISGCV